MDTQNTPLKFWSDVWNEGQIRFHQKNLNSDMVDFFKDHDLKNKTVLIPLAGKTNDILFFLKAGAKVTAIEFYEQAIVDFFTENKIECTKDGVLFKSHNLDFYALDFFDFNIPKTFDVLYDRASQVVFNRELRPRYYNHLSTLIDSHSTLLLFSLDHAGSDDYGPPFKITKEEMISHYKKMGLNLTIFRDSMVAASEKMQEQGILEFKNFTMTNKL